MNILQDKSSLVACWKVIPSDCKFSNSDSHSLLVDWFRGVSWKEHLTRGERWERKRMSKKCWKSKSMCNNNLKWKSKENWKEREYFLIMKKCDIKLQINIQNLLKYTGYKVGVTYAKKFKKNGELWKKFKKRRFDNKWNYSWKRRSTGWTWSAHLNAGVSKECWTWKLKGTKKYIRIEKESWKRLSTGWCAQFKSKC